MTGIEALPIIAGFLAVWLTAWINKPETSSSTKRWVAIAVATVLGLLSLVVNGQSIDAASAPAQVRAVLLGLLRFFRV